jgi:SAM-dependent methyltransferase
MNIEKNWTQYHTQQKSERRYPTEFVVRILKGGKYPQLNMDRSKYKNASILDLSCGDGRNFELLMDLGFRVFATEISEESINTLKSIYPYVDFHQAFNDSLPFSENTFEYVLACHSCYYLRDGVSFSDNMREISRIIKPGGIFIGSMLAPGNFLVQGSRRLNDGSLEVFADPFGLRNGDRVQDACSEEELKDMLYQYFNDICISKLSDNYFGLQVNSFIFVCNKR